MRNSTTGLTIAVLIGTCLALGGCESDEGSGTTDVGFAEDVTPQDNSRFYGIYAGAIEGAGPGTVTVGSDMSRAGEDAQPGIIYLYIPAVGNSQTYSRTQADGDRVTVTVTISGHSITEHSEGKWHGGGWGEITSVWSSDYNSVASSGGGVDQENHTWKLVGTGVRQ